MKLHFHVNHLSVNNHFGIILNHSKTIFFRTKKLMLTHFRNFHQSFKNSNHLSHKSKYLPNFLVPNAMRAVIQSMKQISHLKGQPLITSHNSAFSLFKKNIVDGEQILKNSNTTAQVIVIRVQVRSGSVVAGASVGCV